MQGGSFTISSLGGIGGTASRRSSTRPRSPSSAWDVGAQAGVADGGFVPRLILPLSLSYDHRVIDGAAGRALHVVPGRGAGDVDGLLRAEYEPRPGRSDTHTRQIRCQISATSRKSSVIELHVRVGDTVVEKHAADHPRERQGDDGGALADARASSSKILVQPGDKVSRGTVVILRRRRGRGGAGGCCPGTARQQQSRTAASPTCPTMPAEPLPIGHRPGPTVSAPSSPGVSKLRRAGARRRPGGYTAAFRAADLGLKVTLVERWPTLGGVCLNVGCIPSKALLHAAKCHRGRAGDGRARRAFGPPRVDVARLRGWKDEVVGRLTGGLALAKQRKVTILRGVAAFLSAITHRVAVDDGSTQGHVTFGQCIIAAGSESVRLPGLPDDPRIIDSTGALELELPRHMLVIGGGIIGLEMATVYARWARISWSNSPTA
jgi:dihydrolipoamide dehydrogenase